MYIKKYILIWILLITMTSFVVPSIFVIFFGYDSIAQRMYQISTINQFVILLFGLILIKNKPKTSNPKKCFNYKRCWKGIFLGIISYVMIRLFRDALKWILIGTFHIDIKYLGISGISVEELFYYLILIGILPGICEETFYRKAIIEFGEYKCSTSILSVLLFTAAHYFVGLEAVLGAFLLSIILIKFYKGYEKFILIVLVHIFYNFCEIIFSFIIRFPSDCFYIMFCASSDGECIAVGIIFLIIIMFIFAICYLTNFFTINKKNEIDLE